MPEWDDQSKDSLHWEGLHSCLECSELKVLNKQPNSYIIVVNWFRKSEYVEEFASR